MQITKCPTRYAAGYESASVIRFPKSKASGLTAKKQQTVEKPMTESQMKAIDQFFEIDADDILEEEREAIKQLKPFFSN